MQYLISLKTIEKSVCDRILRAGLYKETPSIRRFRKKTHVRQPRQDMRIFPADAKHPRRILPTRICLGIHLLISRKSSNESYHKQAFWLSDHRLFPSSRVFPSDMSGSADAFSTFIRNSDFSVSHGNKFPDYSCGTAWVFHPFSSHRSPIYIGDTYDVCMKF